MVELKTRCEIDSMAAAGSGAVGADGSRILTN